MELHAHSALSKSSAALKQQEHHKREKEYQRAYKACIACRKRKAKCDLGSSGQQPCARCRREHRECIFPAERSGNPSKRQKVGMHEAEHAFDATNGHSQDYTSPDFAGSTAFHNNESSEATSASPPGPKHGKQISLDDSVMRTVVSRGNEALDILFEAAAHQERANAGNAHSGPFTSLPRSQSSSAASIQNHAVTLSSATAATLELWAACRFVSQGWLSAQEAVTYIDLFFKHMCPLSPIISDFYGRHSNHRHLLVDEPVLCCTILAISSRYHILPGIGGVSRSTILHDRLWRYCQDLLTRTMFGQEKGSSPKTRSIGTVEALLLISEWHPRSLHFPPDNYGWDSDLLLTSKNQHDSGSRQRHYSETSAADQWLNDVIEPARRSDRMSWMLLGSAVTLAHELGIFDGDTDSAGVSDRRIRVRKLLYVYVNHLASRLGYISLIPQSMNQVVSRQVHSTDVAARQWQVHMTSWIELTKLVKSVSDNFFPSATYTSQLLRSGRYIELLHQFLPMLDHWRRVHLENHSFQGSYQETLFIEYHYVRIYINSLGMQAACERALADTASDSDPRTLYNTRIDNLEYEFIKEVIDGSCEILRKVIGLAETDTLRFAPVRLFLRITTSSIFLLKALSLGVRNTQLQHALDILDRSIYALKTSNLDEVHLAARYATLLDTHVQKIRQGFVPNAQRQPLPMNNDLAPNPSWTTNSEALEYPPLDGMAGDDWLSLPFDPSMAPFAPDGTVDFSGLNGGGLDFIWNLPPE
jgi:Fungal Zn(2)-Cys(6) binuclear cluster domain